jgi:ABC-type antimicrobial peptide transport system permease subunit
MRLAADFRSAFRNVRRGGWLSLTVVLILAVAIGAQDPGGDRRSVESMLFGVAPDDTLTFSGVLLVLGIVSLAAAYLPARRAARIEPASALRAE